MAGSDLVALAAKIEAMPIPARLRLCAELVERGQPDMAEAILDTCSDLLALKRLMKPTPLPAPKERP